MELVAIITETVIHAVWSVIGEPHRLLEMPTWCGIMWPIGFCLKWDFKEIKKSLCGYVVLPEK